MDERIKALNAMKEEIGNDLARQFNNLLAFAREAGFRVLNLDDEENQMLDFSFHNGELYFEETYPQ